MSLTAMAAVTVGLHIGSAHMPDNWWHENLNPGVYVRFDQWQAGVYRNTYRRTTAYLGYVQPLGPVDLMVGVASGYQRKCTAWVYGGESGISCQGFSRGFIGPAAALSYQLPIDVLGARPRLWFMPSRGTSAIHLSLEF
jgi:hypothetical protein